MEPENHPFEKELLNPFTVFGGVKYELICSHDPWPVPDIFYQGFYSNQIGPKSFLPSLRLPQHRQSNFLPAALGLVTTTFEIWKQVLDVRSPDYIW